MIYGNSGNDAIHGNNGDDYCLGGSGNDFVAGGDGFDTLNGDSDTFGSPDNEVDQLIFDFWDVGVDGNLGSFLWTVSPKLTSGAYAGHGVYID
jgi:Ca2+-binding RTX toxin-like protein